MNRIVPLAVAGCLLHTAGADLPAQPFVERPGVLEFSGQLIVKPKAGLAPALDRSAREALAPSVVKFYPEVDEYIIAVGASSSSLQVEPGRAENDRSAALLATGLYEYALPNWICYPASVVPNDPWFTQQWHHLAMGSPVGWAITTGRTDQIIAFTDTGIDITHPDLAGRRVPGFDAFTDQAETSGGSVVDLNGHGTHVAGCAGANGDNGQGVAGVNWNARLMMVRVTFGAGGSAYFDDVLQGARWAVDHGAKTISTSFSGVDYQTVQTTGQYIRSRGGLYFYASGNDARNLSNFDWPDVIVVGASSRTDTRVGLSAYGRGVDCFAPGEAIISTIMGGGYQAWTGTSMAAPVASGVASLIWAINPDLTNLEVEEMLLSTCRDIGAPGEDDTFGRGRVDILAATAAALLSGDPPCIVDFTGDGFLDYFDYDAFVDCFEAGACEAGRSADFNGDGFLDFFDYDDFVQAFALGC